jgi:pSer/pThr/pTyr-binding forkhead associated (FHA) protein
VAEVAKELNTGSGQPAAAAAAAGGGPALALVVYQGNRAVKRFSLKDGENSVGQRDDIANVTPDIDLGEYDQVGLVAPLHAKVIKDGDRYFIADLLASTGTQLNGKNLPKNTRTPIKAGDTITLAGNLSVKVEA